MKPARRIANGGRLPVRRRLPAGPGIPGLCGWSGRTQPLAGMLREPLPPELRRFAGGGDWRAGIFSGDLARVRAAAALAVGPDLGPAVDYRLVTEPTGVVWVRHWFAAGPAGTLRGYVQVIAAEMQLRAECVRISEQERARIGQELHDDLCQLLAGTAAMLQGLARAAGVTAPTAQRTLAELGELVAAGMGRARRLAHGLVVPDVVRLGCAAALGELARASGRRFGIRAELRMVGPVPPHGAEVVMHLYRIAQEAIGNAVKHGGASRVALRLRYRGARGRLTVADNGTGIPPAADRVAGLGLQLMGHRAAVIGGVLEVARGGRGGTKVTVDYVCAATVGTQRRNHS